MKYTVHTDGAYSQETKTGGCGYLIITDDTYIYSEAVQIKDVANPAHLETISIGLAAAYLYDNVTLDKNDIVEINTDCLSAVEFVKSCLKSKKSIVSNEKKVNASIKILRELDSRCRLRIAKVKGHKDTINSNTYTDRLSKIAARKE